MINGSIKRFDEVVVDLLEALLECLEEDKKEGRIEIDPTSATGRLIETTTLLIKYVRP